MVELVSAWNEQVERFLRGYEGATVARYAASLRSFEEWYRQSYSDAPDAKLLTEIEVRDYRAYLMTVKGYKAATVNTRLAPIRASRSGSRPAGDPSAGNARRQSAQ